MTELLDKKNEEKKIDNVSEFSNSLTYDDKVIKKIAGYAVSEIPGILAMSGNFITGIADKFRSPDDPTKGINVEVGKKQAAIDMKIICEYGQNIPQVFDNIVDKISSVIKDMTGLEVVQVNVCVYDVLTAEEFERESKKRLSENADDQKSTSDTTNKA